jgi:hypothetical protein
LASQFLLRLARQLGEFSPAGLSSVALELLTATPADALDARSALPPDTRRRALIAQVRAFIHEHLADRDLTPATIAATTWPTHA